MLYLFKGVTMHTIYGRLAYIDTCLNSVTIGQSCIVHASAKQIKLLTDEKLLNAYVRVVHCNNKLRKVQKYDIN